MNTEFLSPKPEATPPVMSVSALNQAVARCLERNFPLLWVSGEVSNFTRAASGHWYFSLKDASAQVRAVMFRGRAQFADFLPKEGDKVEVRTLVSLYTPRGDFQLSVEAIRRAGTGNLYEAFLQLKQKLESEGLFDPQRKRQLPVFPRVIGIVTSPQAAALRDVLTTLQRRAPHLRVILYPVPVQGQGAGQKIAGAIDLASRRAECDVLLVCRGGGSMEDLWSFNEEVVARALNRCRMPVITGIGHETDFTIADFASDLRAPTPTAAAEIAARPRSDWQQLLQSHAVGLTRLQQRLMGDRHQAVDGLARRLVSPVAAVRHERLKLANLQVRLGNAARLPINEARHQLRYLHGRLQARLPDSQTARSHLRESSRRIAAGFGRHLAQQRARLGALEGQLELLNPQRTLERGYAILLDDHGQIVRTPTQLQPREHITARLATGQARVGIASVQIIIDDAEH